MNQEADTHKNNFYRYSKMLQSTSTRLKRGPWTPCPDAHGPLRDKYMQRDYYSPNSAISLAEIIILTFEAGVGWIVDPANSLGIRLKSMLLRSIIV